MPPPDYTAVFGAADLRRFFTAIDRHLAQSAAITVLGGSAIALYGAAVGTRDVDTYETNLDPLLDAISRARKETGLDIPVTPAGVADAPYHYHDRLQREPGRWSRLTIWKLEPHDLALSKAIRGNEHDFAGIEALHRVAPLQLDTLVARYLSEMSHAIGDPAQRDVRLALMIERLFGEIEAERVEERLRKHRARSARRR